MPDRDGLARALLESARIPHAAVDLPSLGAAVETLVASARKAVPDVVVDDTEFVRHVASLLPEGPDLLRLLAVLHGADLLLAFACSRRDPRAIALFEKRFAPEVADAVSRMDRSSAYVDEVSQLLRERLLVGDGTSPPKIVDYAGRGPLTSWLRAAAVRTALTMARRERRESQVEEHLMNAPMQTPDPELDYIRDKYKDEFRAAFREALASLSSRERNILRLYLVDGLNIDHIGVVYRAHRSTVARWIARAREALMERMRRSLMERLKLSPSEFDSLMGAIRSDLDLSLHSFLRGTPE